MRSGGEDLRDLPLHEFAGTCVFHLIADGDFPSGFEEARDIGSGGVEGKATHWDFVASCQRQLQQFGPCDGVFEKHLVEIAQPKEKQSVLRQFRFDLAVLRHHRSQLHVVCHWEMVE